MNSIKSVIAEQMLYKRVHCKCECLFAMDFLGYIKDYEIINNEIIFLIDNKGKIVRIGENHPNMFLEIL